MFLSHKYGDLEEMINDFCNKRHEFHYSEINEKRLMRICDKLISIKKKE